MTNLRICSNHSAFCKDRHNPDHDAIDLFFAYPSNPQGIVDAVEGAMDRMNESGLGVQILGWKDLDIEGRVIFCAICEAIEFSKCITADITGLNFNVLFEFGFAVGLGKRVWPILMASERDRQLYRSFQTLTSIGYSQYRNSRDIFDKLRKRKPWGLPAQLPCPSSIEGVPNARAQHLLYIKSPAEDESSLRLTELVEQYDLRLIIDDPGEVSFQPLPWYIDKIDSSFAVILDLGPQDPEFSLHVAKSAVVAGMALASGRSLLMLSGSADDRPIDYGDLLRVYKNATSATSIAKPFLDSASASYVGLTDDLVVRGGVGAGARAPLITRIELGEYVAQYEQDSLRDYFVETEDFREAMESQYRVIVGRKGTGKSALAYMVQDRLSANATNIVKMISPKGYELAQVLDTTKRLNAPSQGRLIESMWKYMITTEAIAAINDRILEKEVGVYWSDSERRLFDIVEHDPDIGESSFASRLVGLLADQLDINPTDTVLLERDFLSKLHRDHLNLLRDALCDYLSESRRNLVIIIDEIVPHVFTAQERQEYSEILLGLIAASAELRQEWSRGIQRKGGQSTIKILTLIRSDIFASMLEHSEEPDKLDFYQIFWDDPGILLDLVGQRITRSMDLPSGSELSWNQILESPLTLVTLKDHLERSILFRPRDVLYFFKRALFYANRRNGEGIGRRDVQNALRDYSEYALQALSAEWSAHVPDMLGLLLGFWGESTDFSYDSLRNKLIEHGVREEDVEDVVRFLIEAQFIGLAIGEREYRFAKTPAEASLMMRQAGRYLHERGGERGFRVHPAYHESLALTERARRRAAS